MLDSETAEMTFRLPAGSARPLVSLNRDFSAPVRLKRALSRDERLALVRAETDPFNTWDGLQTLIKEEILILADGSQTAPDPALTGAIGEAVRGAMGDPAFAALLTRLPDVGELFLEREPADPVALAAARRKLQAGIAAELSAEITATLSAASPAPYNPGAEQASIRALRSAFILLLGGRGDAASMLHDLYRNAPNMTEQLSALRALTLSTGPGREEALADFEAQWRENPLVMDKWFSVRPLLVQPKTSPA